MINVIIICSQILYDGRFALNGVGSVQVFLWRSWWWWWSVVVVVEFFKIGFWEINSASLLLNFSKLDFGKLILHHVCLPLFFGSSIFIKTL